MAEALARSHNDLVLSRPTRPAPRRDRPGWARIALARLLSRPSRTIAGAVLTAILTGIVINALVMQKERHPAPLFAPPKPATVTAAPPAPAPAAIETPPALPPVRPASLGPASEAAPLPPVRSGDPIRDLLRADATKEPSHLTLAAQNALIKLGFAVKADGVDGASTRQAIQQFERAHGLTSSGEITARLVKQLNAAASAAGR